MTPDLVVIGAGPAGLATAIAAARHGVHTLVVEKRSLPIDKACGEGLLPNGVEALLRLGLGSSALTRSSAPIKGIRYITASGGSASSTFPTGTGLGMRRVCLSEALVARAREEPALEIRSGALAEVQWSRHGARVTVGGTTWQPRLVIGADGLHSRVCRAAGIATNRGRRRRWGMRQHFSGDGWSDYVEVYFGRRFEAYVTPVADGVNVAWLWDQDAISGEQSLERSRGGGRASDLFLARMPSLAEKLAGRRATDRAEAAGPFRHQPRQRARDGVLLVGDAAGYLDPLTGEGVGLALTQAEEFERHVVPLLAVAGARVLPARALRPYLRAVDAVTRSNRDLTRLMLSLSARPRLVERIVSALAADPVLFAHCLDANIGRKPMWAVPAASLIGLVRQLVR